MSALYENDALLALTSGALHPGGAALTARAVAAANLAPGCRICDVGCGTGGAVRMLREQGFDASGIDASEKLVRLAGSPFVTLGDGRKLAGSHDALLLECVLSLLGERTAFLQRAVQTLPIGGKLILCEPYRRGAAGMLAVASCVNGVPDEAGYRELLEDAGFARCVWQDETDALRSFVAMLIFAFGSADTFICEATGGCAAIPPGLRLGYAASVWERCR